MAFFRKAIIQNVYIHLTSTVSILLPKTPPRYPEPARMTRLPKSRKPKQSRLQQQSALLSLPPEIRDEIYRYVLISPTPVDLWPNVYHTDLGGNAEWEARTSTWSENTPLRQLPYKTRNQVILNYVRKEMGTGLLGTCRQVYNEAAMYFWADNLFRFSGRSGWQGLLRFFLTIGPAARSRIRRLDVHAPIYMRWPEKNGEERHGDERDLNGHSKNFPKMHMAKISSEGHLDRIAVQRVCAIMAQDRTLEEINFVIPAGFRNGDEDSYGGYTHDHDTGEDSHDRLHKVSGTDFIKKTVVVEAGGYLAVSDGPKKIMDEGWDLVCLPGSAIYEKNEGDGPIDYEKHQVSEKRTWMSTTREWDYLLGLSMMFQTPEPLDVHANGGKHTKSSLILKRALQGFGGCNFVVDNNSDLRIEKTITNRWTIRYTSISIQANTIRLADIVQTWTASRKEWDYLAGVPQLFRDEEEDAVVQLKTVKKEKLARQRKQGKQERQERQERQDIRKRVVRKSRGLEAWLGDRIGSGEGSTSRAAD